MGLLVECPACRYRNSIKTESCKCGQKLSKLSGKIYWIEYYDNVGNRKRERIGPSKQAAEQRLRNVMTARTEDRHIQKDPGAKLSLGELSEWYLNLEEVKAKSSIQRDIDALKNLKRILGEKTKIKDITSGKIEAYQQIRLKEQSQPKSTKTVRPATVNRELTVLKALLNRALRYKKITENPISQAKKLPENNVREKVLEPCEFQKLLDACVPHLKPVVLMAYYTAMRKSEILELTWDELDLENGFIRLSSERTKTRVARSVPLHPIVIAELQNLSKSETTNRVFLYKGQPISSIKKSFKSACEKAGLKDFTFHDIRHCAINDLRLANNDYFKIMAVSGHKTMSVFKRYNLVTDAELKTVTWRETST